MNNWKQVSGVLTIFQKGRALFNAKDACIHFHVELRNQLLEKESELTSAKKQLADLEQYQVLL